MAATRSFVIPVLNFSPHSPYNIRTLLEDLRDIEGEVIIVFNGIEPFQELAHHPRITRFAFNSQNCGVNRSWSIGSMLALNDQIFFLNADLHVTPEAIESMSSALAELPNALAVAPEGHHMDWPNFGYVRTFRDRTQPMPVDSLCGFCFAVDRVRFLEADLGFDPNYVPCFCEEWDLALQRRFKAPDQLFYVVPAPGIEHVFGATYARYPVFCFGTEVDLNEAARNSARLFVRKWHGAIGFSPKILAL